MLQNNKDIETENITVLINEGEVNPSKETQPKEQIINSKQPIIIEIEVKKSQQHSQQLSQGQPLQQLVKQPSIPERQSTNLKSTNVIQIKQQIGEEIQNQSQMKLSVRIQVTSSIQKGSGFSKHFFYHIQGKDDHGTIDIWRRYSQFQSLKKILYERWPGCFIPAITNKSLIKNAGEKEKHLRTIFSNFLLGLSYSPHLYYKESPQVNISEMFEKMPILQTKDVISRFKSCFGQEVEEPSSSINSSIISNYITSLRKTINNLGSLSRKALALCESYDIYTQNVSRFGQFQRTYQALNLAQYTNNDQQQTILIKDSQNSIQRLNQLNRCNPFYKLYSFLNNQSRDAEAFLEVINASEFYTLRRHKLEVEIRDLHDEIGQIVLGHNTMKTITTRRSKQQVQTDLEIRHKKLIQQRQLIIEMFNILEILISSKSISLYKKFKRDNYRAILNEWTEIVRQSSVEIETVWRFSFQEAKQLLKT